MNTTNQVFKNQNSTNVFMRVTKHMAELNSEYLKSRKRVIGLITQRQANTVNPIIAEVTFIWPGSSAEPLGSVVGRASDGAPANDNDTATDVDTELFILFRKFSRQF